MKVLVTGGAGFVGSHVCDLLVERGDEVYACDNLLPQVHPSGKRPDYLDPRVNLPVGAMVDIGPGDLDYFDAVIHLAARVGVGQSMDVPVSYITTNVRDTAHLLSMMINHKPKLVIASSMSVYGEGSRHHGVTEDWPCRPRSVYATSKLSSEQIALQLADYHGIEAVALRYFNIYGPRQQLSNPYTGLGAIFTRQIRAQQRPTVFEDGLQLRDFIHVSDVARATVDALDAPSGVYNIGTGEPTSVLRFAELLCAANDSDLEPLITGTKRKGDIRYCWADNTEARCFWEPEISLHQGIHAFAAA